MLIPTSLAKITGCADNESARYALAGVRLERDATGPVAVACDGRRLLACRWQEEKADEYPAAFNVAPVADFSTIIPSKSWAEAMKLPLKRCPKPILTRLALEEVGANGKVTLGATDIENTRKIDAVALEGLYPKWRDAIPDYKPEQVATIKLDLRLLSGLLGSIPTDKQQMIELYVPLDGNQAIAIMATTTEGVDTTGLLYPIVDTKEKNAARKAAEERFSKIDRMAPYDIQGFLSTAQLEAIATRMGIPNTEDN